MDPSRRPESHDPGGFPPSPYMGRPSHPNSPTQVGHMVLPPPFLDRRRAIPLLYADLEKRGGPSSEPRPRESSRRTFGEAASGGRRAGEAALRRAPHHRWGTRTGGADISWAAAITNGPGSRKEPLHGQVPRRPGSQNAGFPEGGRMTWHSFLERDTSAGGPLSDGMATDSEKRPSQSHP